MPRELLTIESFESLLDHNNLFELRRIFDHYNVNDIHYVQPALLGFRSFLRTFADFPSELIVKDHINYGDAIKIKVITPGDKDRPIGALITCQWKEDIFQKSDNEGYRKISIDISGQWYYYTIVFGKIGELSGRLLSIGDIIPILYPFYYRILQARRRNELTDAVAKLL